MTWVTAMLIGLTGLVFTTRFLDCRRRRRRTVVAEQEWCEGWSSSRYGGGRGSGGGSGGDASKDAFSACLRLLKGVSYAPL